MKRASIALACLFVLLTPLAAHAWTASAGWVRADVGLHENGDGFTLGIGNRTPMGGILDLAWSVDWVQKKGVQPSVFTNPTGGIIEDDAEVTLQYFQPSAYVGASLARLPLRPRVFVGGSFALKSRESWNDFPGEPATRLAYDDSDFVGHVGLNLGMGPVDLDLRYTHGFGSSLIEDNTDRTGGLKADDELPGVDPPEIDAKISTWQVGVVYSF